MAAPTLECSMDFDPPMPEATLVRRYKRFLADLQLADGSVLTVHCPNTGSMLNCQQPGAKVLYMDSGNQQRKYRHTLQAVTTPSGAWAGINTSLANPLVEEALQGDVIAELKGYAGIRREVPYGHTTDARQRSRIDFLLQGHIQQPDCYVEVKNVTLERSAGRLAFPDAVTERGRKHLQALMELRAQGFRAALLFCVQHNEATSFQVAADIDPGYAATLAEAIHAGVEVMAYGAILRPDCIRIDRPLQLDAALAVY